MHHLLLPAAHADDGSAQTVGLKACSQTAYCSACHNLLFSGTPRQSVLDPALLKGNQPTAAVVCCMRMPATGVLQPSIRPVFACSSRAMSNTGPGSKNVTHGHSGKSVPADADVKAAQEREAQVSSGDPLGRQYACHSVKDRVVETTPHWLRKTCYDPCTATAATAAACSAAHEHHVHAQHLKVCVLTSALVFPAAVPWFW